MSVSKLTKTLLIWFLPAVLLLLSFPDTAAQSTTGTVVGVVKEQSGGVVPGAEVQLINQGTGIVTSTVAGDEGAYAFNLVTPGHYSVQVSLVGFQTAVIRGVSVQVNKSTKVDALLKLGEISDQIEVAASSSGLAIDTVSAQVGTNVTTRFVSELPTLSRNPLEFAMLAPGVDMDFGQTVGGSQVLDIQGSYASVNGNRSQRNSFYMDGSDNSTSFRNSALQFPNPDAVQELQISTSNTSAEFGKQVGGTFNVITKSGTNDFHGSAFYFFRNKSLNANDWNRNRNGSPRPDDNWKQVGGTLGGPIWKNKTFFFASFMAFRDRSSGFQDDHRFPTAAMVTGDFSGVPIQLYHPVTNEPIPSNNLAAAGLLDPVAQNLAKLLPTVSTYGDFFIWDFDRPTRNQELLTKVDHQLNQTHSFSFSYLRTWGDVKYPDLNGSFNHIPAWGPQVNENDQTTMSVRHTWTASPNFILENRFNNAIQVADRGNANLGKDLSDFGAQNWTISQEGARKYLPELTVQGTGFQGRQGWLSLFDQANYRFGSTVTWIKGKHNVKYGAEFQRDKVRQLNDQPNGNLNFDGRYSSRGQGRNNFGYAFADFMMGRTTGFAINGVLDYDLYSWSNFFFLQDSWKISPRLTLTPGLRYEFYTPTRERDNKLSAFILNHQSTQYANAPLHMAFAGDSGVPDGLFEQDRNNLAPRLGVAYDLSGDGKTALRGGFGMYYSYNASQIKMLTGEQMPWRFSANAADAILSNPWLTSQSPVYTAPPTPFNPDPSNFNFPSQINRLMGFAPDFATPYSFQWNFSIERELVPGITVDAGYVGNRGYKLTQTLPINFALWRDDAADTGASRDARRPIANYGEINLVSSVADSWYDSLQLATDVRLGPDLTSRFTYVLGKGFDVTGADPTGSGIQTANPLDPEGEKGQSQRRHTVRAFYIYDIPWLKNSQSVAGKVLGGWELSGILTAQTGNPLDVTLGQDWNYDGVGGDRPDLIGPITYLRRSNADGSLDWLNLGPNREPFALPGGGTDHNTFGNLVRNAVWGPGSWNADMALLKNFWLNEGMRVQVRIESYNVFNNNNLNNPNLTFNSVDFGTIRTRTGHRRMQLGLRFVF